MTRRDEKRAKQKLLNDLRKQRQKIAKREGKADRRRRMSPVARFIERGQGKLKKSAAGPVISIFCLIFYYALVWLVAYPVCCYVGGWAVECC